MCTAEILPRPVSGKSLQALPLRPKPARRSVEMIVIDRMHEPSGELGALDPQRGI
jgi:hypothetical protein